MKTSDRMVIYLRLRKGAEKEIFTYWDDAWNGRYYIIALVFPINITKECIGSLQALYEAVPIQKSWEEIDKVKLDIKEVKHPLYNYVISFCEYD